MEISGRKRVLGKKNSKCRSPEVWGYLPGKIQAMQ